MIREGLLLTPQYREYVWGGKRLRPGQTTAEAWVVYEEDLIASGSLAGRRLADVAAEHTADLLGKRVVAATGERFPLLIKLLDCAEWLSLQVHPNDEQARQLEGPGQFGKTEAWHFIDVEPGAEILCGLKPGTSAVRLAEAIRQGTIVDVMQRLPVRPGDSIYIPAGTIHALGPGLLLYEVQQTSNLTYRVFDWNRPATPQRPLHIDKSLAVANPAASSQMVPLPRLGDGDHPVLVTSPYFTLELVAGEQQAIAFDTHGDSFQALTVVAGRARLEGEGWQLDLDRFGTAIVPADAGAFRVVPLEACRVLRAYVK